MLRSTLGAHPGAGPPACGDAIRSLLRLAATGPASSRNSTGREGSFVEESRLAGAMNHPNIVTAHEYFEHDGIPYIAMEYLSRGSLRRYLPAPTPAQIAGILDGARSNCA